jgi:hypothetical protein
MEAVVVASNGGTVTRRPMIRLVLHSSVVVDHEQLKLLLLSVAWPEDEADVRTAQRVAARMYRTICKSEEAV